MSKLVRFGLVAALACAAAGSACNKQGGTDSPGGRGGAAGAPAAGDGVQLRYGLAATKLKQKGKIDLNTSGGGKFGQAAIEYSALLDVVPNGDKLKVSWSFADIGKLDLQGLYKDASGDPKTMLLTEGRGAFVVDVLGTVDEKGTEALQETTARRERFKALAKEGGAGEGKEPSNAGALQLLAMTDAMVSLPDLPKESLAVGKPITVEREEETQLGDSGVMLPTDIESKFTLVKIDESGGQRIAELQVEVESSGATEMQGNMIAVESTTEGSMLFDLGTGLPVSYKFTRNTSFTFGQNSLENTMIAEAAFEKG